METYWIDPDQFRLTRKIHDLDNEHDHNELIQLDLSSLSFPFCFCLPD